MKAHYGIKNILYWLSRNVAFVVVAIVVVAFVVVAIVVVAIVAAVIVVVFAVVFVVVRSQHLPNETDCYLDLSTFRILHRYTLLLLTIRHIVVFPRSQYFPIETDCCNLSSIAYSFPR